MQIRRSSPVGLTQKPKPLEAAQRLLSRRAAISLLFMQNRLHWKLLLGTILFLSLPAVARAAFIPGDVLYVANKSVYNIRNGGSFAAAKPLASLPDIVLGQSAFDLNLDAAYISQTQLGEILKVTSDGVVSVFAQVPHGNFGMIRTRDGRLLSTIGGGRVADISPGGNLTSVTPFATGLGFTRGMLQTSDGRILIASQDTGKVFDITSGGNFSNATPFASGLDSAASLVEDANRRIFVSQFTLGRVTDITAGGNFSTATAFATGRSFMGLTIDGQGRMLASPIGSVALPGSVYDITAGGNFQFAPAFATGVTSGETSITTAPVPEPSIPLSATTSLLLAMLLQRRCASSSRALSPPLDDLPQSGRD
jgi:hypothetical protein